MRELLILAFHQTLKARSQSKLQKIRQLFVLAHALQGQSATNVRSLYYYYPDLYHTPNIAYATVRQLERKTGLSMRQMGVQATAKGLYLHGDRQALIDADLQLEDPPYRLLVLEKDTIFQKFKALSGLPKDLAIVTGKGFPDRKTLEFIQKHFASARVYGLCDCNIYGHWILKQYADVCTNFTAIGLFEGQSGATHDQQRIAKLQQDLLEKGHREWCDDLERMRASRQGEIDDLVREHGEQWLVESVLAMLE